MQVWCMCILISVFAVCCKKCGSQWHLFASVQWLNSWWRRKSSSAISVLCMHFVAPVSEGGWGEVQMNMTYVAEHVKTWYMLQIQWLTTWLMMKASTKKWQVTSWSGMSCCLQTRRLELYCWPPGLWKSVVAYWLICSLKCEPWAQLSLLTWCMNCHVHLVKKHLLKQTYLCAHPHPPT